MFFIIGIKNWFSNGDLRISVVHHDRGYSINAPHVPNRLSIKKSRNGKKLLFRSTTPPSLFQAAHMSSRNDSAPSGNDPNERRNSGKGGLPSDMKHVAQVTSRPRESEPSFR